MKRFSLILASVVLLAGVLAGCGKKEEGVAYKTPFFQMTIDKKWIQFDYPKQYLEVKNAYTFTLLTYSPANITNPNQDVELPYGFTITSFANNTVKESVFDNPNLLPFPRSDQVKIIKSEYLYYQGLKARLEEAEINVNTFHNFSTRLIIPLDGGYIELDGWGSFSDTQLADDYRALIKTLVITNKNHFKEHPEAGGEQTP
jgi:hypothetical protein